MNELLSISERTAEYFLLVILELIRVSQMRYSANMGSQF